MKRLTRCLLLLPLTCGALVALSSCSSRNAASGVVLTPRAREASAAGVRFDDGTGVADTSGPAASAAVAEEATSGPVEEPPAERWLADDGARSGPLACGLSNPMPGGVTAGYAADTGLDLAGAPRDVFAIASGVLEYSEGGHTAWRSAADSPYAIRIRLDAPIEVGDRQVTHVWYAHLSAIVEELPEGGPPVRVAAGQRLGKSGSANGSPHLHLGLLLDGDVEQGWGTFLREDAVRAVLCGLGTKIHLPDR